MPRFTSPFDGAKLFYRDFVPAKNPPPFNIADGAEADRKPALVFLHQWPLSSRMYDPLLSDWSGPEHKGDIDYSVLARDVISLVEQIQPGPFVFIAASMGTGETVLAHGLSEYGYIWISTSLPLPVASPEFPDGPPRELWDHVLSSLRSHRSQFVSNNFRGPLGVGVSGNVTDKDIEIFERIFDAADALAIERAARIFTSEDLTGELVEFGKTRSGELLLIHGGADGGVPLAASAHRIQKLIPDARLTVYDDGGHGEYFGSGID
ncbi:hypothetical protein CEP53_003283 [Fusarium sp. AF-6]|nr:hypothetical protein CEP53_003283 [Fusarium sp. AF-6]